MGKPYIAPIEDKLHEIRIEQDTHIYRVLYIAYTGKRFILLHGFQKKTQKTPKKELDLAKERMKTFSPKRNCRNPLKTKSRNRLKGKNDEYYQHHCLG